MHLCVAGSGGVKGIILAGGKGTRLHPITLGICKQLLPVYDKPMIYYPLAVLMQAGIREILIISTPEDLPRIEQLFGAGEDLGLTLSYAAQEAPNGIPEAFLIGEHFIGDQNVALILGDNLFYSHDFSHLLKSRSAFQTGAQIFACEVKDPERYGVLAFDSQGNVIDIVEKPQAPPSRYAVTGLYFYDNHVVDIAKQLKPSSRGEFEITDINRLYLKRGALHVHLFNRGFAWLDMGTAESLHSAGDYVKTIQDRHGMRIACLEEIAHEMGYLSKEAIKQRAEELGSGAYAAYLQSIYCN